MARVVRQRYIIRLHKDIREQMDRASGKAGHLTPTYISIILEQELKKENLLPYELGDTEGVFQPKVGRREQGREVAADKQMSIYLSDFAYEKIREIVAYLKEEVDRTIGPAYVIRDILYKWLKEQ